MNVKCPHCDSPCNSLILETRKDESGIYRRRLCFNCAKSIVTREYADKAFKMPLRVRVRKTRPTDTLIVVTNKNVFNVWK